MRIAYFTNQYPAVSHTFIRREIQAMEALGVSISRFALRAGPNLVDSEDISEKAKTRYLLKVTLSEICCCVMLTASRPLAVYRCVRDAVRIGWRSDRGLLRHFVYVIEAIMLASSCLRGRIQHLHAHFGTNSAAIAMLAWRISGIPYSFTVHGPDEFERAELLSLDQKLEYAAFAVCVSAFGRSQLMRWSRPNQWSKIAIVRCGVSGIFLTCASQKPPNDPRLVCIGRIDVQKAQLVLVDAANRLNAAGVRCEIIFAGDGPMRPDLEEAIRRAGLQDNMKLTGWISGERVKSEILGARALVLPSFAENLPVIIMEALALGRPVISTYIAGIPELVRPGSNGWLVPASDEIALAEAMREVIEAPVEKLAAMGNTGRRDILERHNTLKETEKLKSMIEMSLSTRKLPFHKEESKRTSLCQ